MSESHHSEAAQEDEEDDEDAEDSRKIVRGPVDPAITVDDLTTDIKDLNTCFNAPPSNNEESASEDKSPTAAL